VFKGLNYVCAFVGVLLK